MKPNQIWGLIFFTFGSLLYTLNQTVQMLLFANVASEIIFTLICYFLISLGIALTLFENASSQSFVGFLSLIVTIMVFNGILLVYDSFNAFQYTSTDYFVLLLNSINLSAITDNIALILIVICPTLGIIFWMLISKDDLPQGWYYMLIFGLVLFLESWIFATMKGISIF